MSEAESLAPADFKRPGDSENVIQGEIPDPYAIPLEEINPVSAKLFAENKMFGFFKRLREEDPVHFNTTELAGRYWSLTKYEDIKAVDSDHENFSSAHGITLGLQLRVTTEKGDRDLGVKVLAGFDEEIQPLPDLQSPEVYDLLDLAGRGGLNFGLRNRVRENLGLGEVPRLLAAVVQDVLRRRQHPVRLLCGISLAKIGA